MPSTQQHVYCPHCRGHYCHYCRFMACTRFFLVPEDFVGEVDAMIKFNGLSARANQAGLTPDIKIIRGSQKTPTSEPALANEPPALIRVELDARPQPLWFGFLGVTTELNHDTPVALQPYGSSGLPQAAAKLGAVGSRLQFELAPAYSLIGLVPNEPNWFSVNSPDPLQNSQFAALAWKMKATYSIGKCRSESGNVVLLFEVNGRLVVAAE